MKASELAEFIDGWTAVVAPSPAAASGIQVLRTHLERSAQSTMASIIAKLKKVPSVPAGDYEHSWEPVLDYFDPLLRFAGLYCKPALAKDTNALFTMLAGIRHADASRFIDAASQNRGNQRSSATAAPVRIDIVQKYNRMLERALGDDSGFADAVVEINNPSILSTPELLLLAKQFALAPVKTRPAALKKIRARHEALMASRAKSSATGGRVAG